MPRAAARFTQADIARALRAIEQEKARAAIEIAPSGTIRIVPIDDEEAKKRQPQTAKTSENKEIVL